MAHHEVLLADPAVSGELFQHRDKVLDAAVPVAEKEDHHEQGQDAEEEPHHLQVSVGHLREQTGRLLLGRYFLMSHCNYSNTN